MARILDMRNTTPEVTCYFLLPVAAYSWSIFCVLPANTDCSSHQFLLLLLALPSTSLFHPFSFSFSEFESILVFRIPPKAVILCVCVCVCVCLCMYMCVRMCAHMTVCLSVYVFLIRPSAIDRTLKSQELTKCVCLYMSTRVCVHERVRLRACIPTTLAAFCQNLKLTCPIAKTEITFTILSPPHIHLFALTLQTEVNYFPPKD